MTQQLGYGIRKSIPLGAGGYLRGGSVSIRLHGLPSGEVIQVFRGYSAPIYDVAFSLDGRIAQTGEHLWNLVTGNGYAVFRD